MRLPSIAFEAIVSAIPPLRPTNIIQGLIARITDALVGARGFEPPASASRTLRSTRLSHAPSKVMVPKVGVEPT